MQANKPERLLSRLGVLAVAALLSGCGSQAPIDPDQVSRPDEIQAGPGLITGSEGAYSVDIKRPS
jgi:ABC-type uncharacterized transport system auxiliary subunit